MTFTDNNIIETYTHLLEGLSALHKIELIESLAKSLKTNDKTKDDRFYSSFGAWSSGKSTEEIVAEIKESRKFRTKEIQF